MNNETVAMADNSPPFVAGDFFIPLDNDTILIIPLHQGVELGAWLISNGLQIALETAELALDKSGRGIR